MKCTDITLLDPADTKVYVTLGGCPADFAVVSESGKALEFGKPAHLGKQWYPVSILRRAKPSNPCFPEELLVPVWFLNKNNIQY
tara:strand:+ start:1039 stop:1290 length:252 start_codon:yes stop_codon:yes gene_type:complete